MCFFTSSPVLRVVLASVTALFLFNGVAYGAPVSRVVPAAAVWESEPNDATADALAVGEVGRFRGSLSSGDVDYYAISVTAGSRLYAATMTHGSTAHSDTNLVLIGSDGVTVLETDYDDGTFTAQSSSIAGHRFASGGTVYLKVYAPNSVRVHPYELWVQVRSTPAQGEDEPNDTSVDAHAVPAGGGQFSGSTTTDADLDLFTVSLNAGDAVFASLDLDPERDNTTWNGSLRYGPEGEILHVVNDLNATSPNSEAAFFSVASAGRWTIGVDTPDSGSFGTYRLNISVIPGVSRTCDSYSSTGPVLIPDNGAGTVESAIEVPDSFYVESVQVDVRVSHHRMADLDYTLASPGGSPRGLMGDQGPATPGAATAAFSLHPEGATAPWTPALGGLFLKAHTHEALPGFAGSESAGSWRLQIADDTADSTGILESWALTLCREDPVVETEPVFSADFDTDDGGFTHSGPGDEWEWGIPTGAPVASCRSGSCWDTDLDGTYANSANQTLVSPPIDLAGQTRTLRLEWWHKYALEGFHYDKFWVDVRVVGDPLSTRRVYSWQGFNSRFSFGSTQIDDPVGWTRSSADISSFAGQTIEVVFTLATDSSVTYDGVAIDDVRVLAAPEPPPTPAPTPAPSTPPAPAPVGGGAPPARNDTVAPTALISAAKIRIGSVLGGKAVRFVTTLSEPATVKASLVAHVKPAKRAARRSKPVRVVLGSVRSSSPIAGKRTLVIKPTKGALKRMRKHLKTGASLRSVTIVGSATDQAGNVRSFSRRIKVR